MASPSQGRLSETRGRVDAVFDVPGEFLTQRINFDFDLTFSPRQLCSPTIAPMTFQLDPRSTLTMQRGGAAAGGFDATTGALIVANSATMDLTSVRAPIGG